MKTRLPLATGLLAGLLAFPLAPQAAHAEGWLSALGVGSSVKGSGRLTTDSRALAAFQAIELQGEMNLVLRQGAREAVELRGDDNILPLIESRVVVREGVPTLVLGPREGTSWSASTPVIATVDLKTLSALALSGSGDIGAAALKTPALRVSLSGAGKLHVDALETEDLTTRIAGSGDLRLAGHATRASFTITGSGDIDAARLASEDVNVKIAGSGDAAVNAGRTLRASIAGSGKVSYTGAAKVTSSVAGSGEVRKR